MKEDKVKKFKVTQSLRLPGVWMKVFYYGSFLLLGLAAVGVIYCLATGTRGSLMGVSVIGGLLGVIWFVMVSLMSENSFGFSRIAFLRDHILFTSGDNSFRLPWEKVVECGIEKTRRSYWVYASDHKLSEDERKEFPENVSEGVFYFNYYPNTWEEFMLYLPEPFKTEMQEKGAKHNF